MDVDKISARQLAVCAFVGGLAPAAAGTGGGWQGALLAVPAVLLAGRALTALAPRWRRLERKWTGRVLSLLFALWGAALLSRGLVRCAVRAVAAGGTEERHKMWIVVLMALPVMWMAHGKPAAFFRAVEIFWLAMAAVGAALLVWAAFKVDWRYAALPAEDLWGGFWAAVETAGTFLFVLPYVNRIPAEQKEGGRVLTWLGALAGTAVLMELLTAGVLSPAVASGSGTAFFLMTAALGRAVRVEGLVSALWLLADLACLGLLARSWQRTGTGRSWLPVLAAAVGALCAAAGLPAAVPAAVWGWGTAALAGTACVFLLCVGKDG